MEPGNQPSFAQLARRQERIDGKGYPTVTDNRTGYTYELPIQDGTIGATDLTKTKTSSDDPGIITYDPGCMNTGTCRSSVTYVDGDKGIWGDGRLMGFGHRVYKSYDPRAKIIEYWADRVFEAT